MCETACNDKARDEKCCRCLSQTTGEYARRVLAVGEGQGWAYSVAEFYDAVLESSRDWEQGVFIYGCWEFFKIDGHAYNPTLKRRMFASYIVGMDHVRVCIKDKRTIKVIMCTRTGKTATEKEGWEDRETLGVFEAGREKESWAPILACIQEACEACGFGAKYLLK